MAEPLRAVLVGCGNRGRMFGRLARECKEMIRIVSIAEPRDEWRADEAALNGLPPECAFTSFEEALSPSAPAADVALIATNDRTHYAATLAALGKGCHVLLEKPVAHDPVMAAHMALAARQKGLQIAVQHELRYSPFFQEIRRLVREGTIGQVYSYTHTEHVEFWHMTHSFVRGNWNNSDQENPMILAKCCHDLDLMPWIIGDEVTKVSSFGRLDHFTPANKPAGAPERCTDGCPVQETCIHDAEAFYMGPCTTWPVAMLGPGFSKDSTREERRRRLAESPYSRCVYNGHNNVVDHQTVMMETQRGAICTLTMEGFSIGEECGRKIRLDGTLGTIRGDMGRGMIMVYRHWHGPFGTKAEPEIIDLKAAGLDGHGGGDERLFTHVIECFWKGTSGGDDPLTTIDESVESHLLAWAAEQARGEGKVVHMDEFRRQVAEKAEAMMGR
ncbi:MAG: Gfo/Idh/MocA family oxidoreductase [Planctomycetes bacterium]|nr:Gfo/Idh/MocA family oxidoreductase [Planctomycetota bacterium]